ncbi:hypothetical protein [Sphingobium sp. LB126]|nr:hypothetical protein [Sphingobium sp. LB126]
MVEYPSSAHRIDDLIERATLPLGLLGALRRKVTDTARAVEQ